MELSKQIAKHFREIYFGGNWTVSCMRDVLSDVNWKQATTKVHSFNTIATLVFHTNYFVSAVLKVLRGGELDANDKFSFDHPPINSEEDWKKMQNKSLEEAEATAVLIETLTDEKLYSIFVNEKYGTYYRNLHGIIEHTHYHLGQIVIIKKLIQEEKIQS